MAFRDHLAGAHKPDEALSCIHGLFDLSQDLNHSMILADIIEAPGHRAALNVLARDRLCAVLNVEPGELIDVLGWAMQILPIQNLLTMAQSWSIIWKQLI